MSTEVAQRPAKASGQAPDPWDNPIGYLRHYNWRPEGDPRNPATRWFDPRRSLTGKEEKIKIGEKKLPGNKKEDIHQVHYTPPAWPMTREEAVVEQMRRDEEEKAKKG